MALELFQHRLVTEAVRVPALHRQQVLLAVEVYLEYLARAPEAVVVAERQHPPAIGESHGDPLAGRGVVAAGRARGVGEDRGPRCVEEGEPRGRLEHGDFDVLAAGSALPGEQGRQRGLRSYQAGYLVDHGVPDELRLAAVVGL